MDYECQWPPEQPAQFSFQESPCAVPSTSCSSSRTVKTNDSNDSFSDEYQIPFDHHTEDSLSRSSDILGGGRIGAAPDPEPLNADSGNDQNLGDNNREGEMRNEEAMEMSENDDGIDTENDVSAIDAPDETNPYAPFPSKTFALLYFLLFGGRYIVSRDLQEGLWWVLKELQVRDLPRLNSVHQFDSRLPKAQTIQTRNSAGKIFYHNSIVDTKKLSLTNPMTSKQLARIPEVRKENINRLSHAIKWLTNPNFVTPMIRTPKGDWFANDVVKICGKVGNKDYHFEKIKQFYIEDNQTFVRGTFRTPNSFVKMNLYILKTRRLPLLSTLSNNVSTCGQISVTTIDFILHSIRNYQILMGSTSSNPVGP
ncbi:hypothetical protein BKA69DRAFT_1125020 [Paraphysoderma sedebokerense]|nr:hypothetical protein BKA69DRAFT_1125020 [Paraphysoderma sedebokerense]